MRLTYKDNRVVGGYNAIDCDEFACVGRLGQLEDVEDELGIDLITLFKALKNGIWIKHPLGQVYKVQARLYDLMIDSFSGKLKWCFLVDNMFIDFKDYSVTWALTKEELE